MKPQKIAIIGAGFTGISVGVYLAQAGYQVTLFEAAHTLGGRARSITYRDTVLDNGQHIGLGAYRTLLDLLQTLNISESSVFLRLPFEWTMLPNFHLSVKRLPSPWHLIVSLGRARGLSFKERWHFARLLHKLIHTASYLIQDEAVATWLAKYQQSANLIQCFWEPLCLAALNTPLHTASIKILAKILRTSLGTDHHASDLLLPRIDLSELLPNQAAQFIQQHQGTIKKGIRVRTISPYQTKWLIDDTIFDQVVVATAPQELAKITLPSELKHLVTSLSQWPYHSIATVYLQYPDTIKLPRPIIGLVKCQAQWVFDRRDTHGQKGLIAVVISNIEKNVDHALLLDTIKKELNTFFQIAVDPLWSKVIIEKRATFGAVAGLTRTSFNTGLQGLWLAGDYMIEDYPATLESAVLSGKIVSQLIIENQRGEHTHG